MSTEPKNHSKGAESQSGKQGKQNEGDCQEGDFLRKRVESDDVVNFIESMVQAMGTAAAEQYGGCLPDRQIKRPAAPAAKKYQNKSVGTIMQKLERVEKYPDTAKQLLDDPVIAEWFGRSGCKKNEYFEELECAQELVSFFGGHRNFDHAVRAAEKAVAMTLLHRRDDEETLAELYWVLAELHAATDQMDKALGQMRSCLSLIEPGADENHPTYKELLGQLEETRERSRMVALA